HQLKGIVVFCIDVFVFGIIGQIKFAEFFLKGISAENKFVFFVAIFHGHISKGILVTFFTFVRFHIFGFDRFLFLQNSGHWLRNLDRKRFVAATIIKFLKLQNIIAFTPKNIHGIIG